MPNTPSDDQIEALNTVYGGTSITSRAAGRQVVRDVLGHGKNDPYGKASTRGGVSQGNDAENDLRNGATPGQLMTAHLSKLGRDIELTSGAKAGSLTHTGHPELPKK